MGRIRFRQIYGMEYDYRDQILYWAFEGDRKWQREETKDVNEYRREPCCLGGKERRGR